MLYTLATFNDFRDACHNASRSAGWWNDSRKVFETHFEAYPTPIPDRYLVPVKLCLIHSEISEAYEGYMSGANDEHLPASPSALVEFGDTLIRIGDLAGYLDIDMSSAIALVLQADHLDVLVDNPYWNGISNPHSPDAHVCFNRLHVWTSGAMESYRKGNKPDAIIPALSGVAANLARIVILCDLIARKNEWDLPAAAEAKMAYNAVRLDHKAEARNADGGKAF